MEIKGTMVYTVMEIDSHGNPTSVRNFIEQEAKAHECFDLTCEECLANEQEIDGELCNGVLRVAASLPWTIYLLRTEAE
jgi:hypothetical protein